MEDCTWDVENGHTNKGNGKVLIYNFKFKN